MENLRASVVYLLGEGNVTTCALECLGKRRKLSVPVFQLANAGGVMVRDAAPMGAHTWAFRGVDF